MAFIGSEELIKTHGFVIKPGAAVKLKQEKREGYTDFVELDPENIAWNVIRSEFDNLLLRHAVATGVKVFEGHKVTDIKFSGERPVSAIYETDDGISKEIQFDYLVDASGRTGLLCTKYLKNRRFNSSLKNMAFWGYWRGGGRYSPGTTRENAPWFEALTDETGWAWYIPLHDDTISVGVILSKESYTAKKASLACNGEENSTTALYIEQLAQAPGLLNLLGKAKLTSEVRSAGDYSYSAGQYSGPYYRIAGDAGAFIDPFFSSGVHLAFTGGLSAASTIAASIKGHCTETEAAAFHNTK
ncbi:Flavin-dependent halogenase armH2, partial [Termitomyces sp. T32_za158]